MLIFIWRENRSCGSSKTHGKVVLIKGLFFGCRLTLRGVRSCLATLAIQTTVCSSLVFVGENQDNGDATEHHSVEMKKSLAGIVWETRLLLLLLLFGPLLGWGWNDGRSVKSSVE